MRRSLFRRFTLGPIRITLSAMTPTARPATPADVPALSRIWHDGWQEAHADHTPAALHRLRTPDSFATRLAADLANTRAAGPIGAPLGLCITHGDELYQLYVSPAARGTGMAARLIDDGEARIRDAGHSVARLYAIPENARALAFYTKQGWTIGPVEEVLLETLEGPFPLPCARLTKRL